MLRQKLEKDPRRAKARFAAIAFAVKARSRGCLRVVGTMAREQVVDWHCRAKLSPDCITAYGPICGPCEKLADEETFLEAKKLHNAQLKDMQPVAASEICVGSHMC